MNSLHPLPASGVLGRLPLTALRAFEAAARQGSFRRAAAELGITPSAVSHQVAQLEAILGQPLFRRTGGGVELAEGGRLLFPYVRDGFGRIAQGAELLLRAGRRELTIQVYITVAVRWFMPRLHSFQKACPDVLLKVNASQMDWEYDPALADLGMICTTAPGRPGRRYTPLFEADLVLVCSPGLVDGPVPLTSPRDLGRHHRLVVHPANEDWTTWAGAAGIAGIVPASSASFDSYLLVIEAAAEGRGVAVVPHFLASADLKAGRLVQPFSIAARQPARWYLVCREAEADEPAIARFRSWLLDQIATDPVLAGGIARLRRRG
jgi:LysR family glycine cleavage system transcriptional activator